MVKRGRGLRLSTVHPFSGRAGQVGGSPSRAVPAVRRSDNQVADIFLQSIFKFQLSFTSTKLYHSLKNRMSVMSVRMYESMCVVPKEYLRSILENYTTGHGPTI